MASVLGALLLGLLAVSQSDLGKDALSALWQRSSGPHLLLGVCILTAGLVFLACRWRALMPIREGVTVLPLTAYLMAGALLNYAIPGPVGELAAAGLAARRFKMSASIALAASLHARFVGLSVAGVVSLSLLLATDIDVSAELRPWVYLAATTVSVGAATLLLLSLFPAPIQRISSATFGSALLGRLPFTRRIDAAIQHFATALGAVGRLGPRRYLEAAGWAFVGHGTVIFGIYVAAVGLGAWPDPVGLCFTYAMATAGAVVLVAFPGSQVGWDAMFCTLLVTTAALELPDALAITVMVRLQQLLLMVLGVVVLARQGWDVPTGDAG